MENYLEYMFDFEKFAETFLIIKTEFGEMKPFEFNSAQKKVIKKLKETLGIKTLDIFSLMPKNVVLRFIFLKARQQGISTFWQAFLFWWNYILENQKSLTMGHKKDASNNLFDMYKRFHDKLPGDMQNQIERSNEKKISYSIKGSENKIDTAGGGEIGRSDTLQALHLTEVAFYPDAKVTYTALLQGAKYAKMIIVESTANGFNEFYNDWVEAEEGTSEFVPIFLSWLDFPEYIEEAKEMGFIRDFEDELEEEKFMNSLGIERYNAYPDEEKILMEEYGATIEQIKWRRYMITNKTKGDIEKFHQEYPRDPKEAFIASGKPVFPVAKCHQRFAECGPPLKRGDLVWNADRTDVVFQENARGYVSIWTDFEVEDTDKYRFAGGGDIAEGLDQGDYSALRYLDRKTMEVCLTWHGHIDPDLLAEEELKIQKYLKEVYINNEKNNHGVLTINSAYELGVNQMYVSDFEKGYEVGKSELGTRTQGGFKAESSKAIIIDNLNMCIREDIFQDYDKEFWGETLTFVKNAKGQMQAEGKDKDPSTKCFDDRIIAQAKMWQCHEWLPTYRQLKKEAMLKPRYGSVEVMEVDEASF